MILSLGNTLAATWFAFLGAIKEEASNTSSKVKGNFTVASISIPSDLFSAVAARDGNLWGAATSPGAK